MGCWPGHRIDQAFYARASHRPQALRTLPHVTDFRSLLQAGAHPRKRPPRAPQKPVTAVGAR